MEKCLFSSKSFICSPRHRTCQDIWIDVIYEKSWIVKSLSVEQSVRLSRRYVDFIVSVVRKVFKHLLIFIFGIEWKIPRTQLYRRASVLKASSVKLNVNFTHDLTRDSEKISSLWRCQAEKRRDKKRKSIRLSEERIGFSMREARPYRFYDV